MKHYPLLSCELYPQAAVLANGEYPSHPLPLTLLKQAAYVACCDGAADEYIRRGFQPDVIIGDGDSISGENRKEFKNILHFNSDQETNDQTKAVNYCIAQGKKEIIIVGATGKREDHTLGNISLLMDYMGKADVHLVTDYGTFTPVSGNASFDCYPGEQISIINFGASGLKGEGLIYSLSDFTNWWQGTLNETTAHIFKVFAEGKYLIFRTHKSNK